MPPVDTRTQAAKGDALLRDIGPMVVAAFVAWWTTVRPAGFFLGSPWPPRVAAGLAGCGILAAALVLSRGTRHLVPVVLGGFVLPSAAAWVLGPTSPTTLAEPVEVLVGALAWTAIGIVLIRPQAVAVPKGSEGGGGPTIGAGDDAARVAMRELDAAMVDHEPPPRLSPRNVLPRLAQLPLWVAAGLSGLIVYQLLRLPPGANAPERALLARTVGTACVIALLSVGGELVEVRYLTRRAPPARTRLSRTAMALAVLFVLGFVWIVWIGRDR
ncbi:MAG: hypothetical protein IPJ34_18620 [Myxococcales bacterium]|nr:hypothetical protein [Myxococcales bacterium]